MNLINKIRSYFLVLKASGYQGRRRYDKVIELCLRANDITPNSHIVLGTLGNAYFCAGHYEKARSILKDALEVSPFKDQDCPILELIIRTLFYLHAPMEEILPYLRRYLKNQKLHQLKFPWIMKIYLSVGAKIRGKEFNLDDYARGLDRHATDFYLWAKEIANDYEDKLPGKM